MEVRLVKQIGFTSKAPPEAPCSIRRRRPTARTAEGLFSLFIHQICFNEDFVIFRCLWFVPRLFRRRAVAIRVV